MPKIVLAALLLLTGCLPNYRPSERGLQKPQTQSATIDHVTLKKLTGASARYQVKRKFKVLTPDGTFVDGSENVWSGSAFCIGIEQDPKTGQRYSVWVTCRHVADSREVPNAFAEIDYKDASGRLAWALVDKVVLSTDNDFAIFTSLALPQTILELASPAEIDNLEVGDFLFASGHPAGMFPPVITVGIFLGHSSDDIRFTVSATYGSSGSALIDARTLKVVGVIYRFAGGRYRGRFRSDDLKAVSAKKIQQFLNPQSKR